ncbi:hypothetical protein NL529_32775, partial [Klebsiella pneumoniae]|nr:hypothetical protein [Klebsiella pneumoniae]
IEARSRTTSEWAWVPAHSPSLAATVFAPRRHGVEYVVEHVGGDAVLVLTNDGAREFRVVRATLSGGLPDQLSELLPAEEGV